jgi:CHASE2 domain-containing sensor protein
MARYWLTLVTVLWVFIGVYLLVTGKPLRPMLPLIGTASAICVLGMLSSLFVRSGTE